MSCPGKEKFVESAKDLDPSLFRRLVSIRARHIIDPKQSPITKEDDRREVEQRILEKVNQEVNFLPAQFLIEGGEKVEAICRVITPTSYGTGFLIGHGYLMTNNHVLDNVKDAKKSIAEFDFEQGKQSRRIAIDPNRFFITDKELDFTIVACSQQGIADIKPLPLTRNPATVTRYERVNIIQHPEGLPKKVALHDNKVIRVMDKVIRYRTDTAPGSSGSPVFNNEWELIALHHAGWKDDINTATNEGIRASAIVAHLLGLSQETSKTREDFRPLLAGITGVSPYLGFFDFYGVGDFREIQVADFNGTSDFADIGFWNIEHFNNRVSNRRIEDIADVIDRLSMDVLGLVEVEEQALNRLVASLGNRGNGADFVLLNVRGSQDIAVLYDSDTTSVTLRNDLNDHYRQRLDAKTTGGKKAFPRDPLFAKCNVMDGNQQKVEFLMIVVHLKAFGDAQSRARRKLAAEILAEIINDIQNREDIPVVLGGDFNDALNTDVFSSLQDSPDLFALTADDERNPDAATYIGRRYSSVIDNIIVSKDLKMGDISGDDAAIVRLDSSIRDFSDRISDHVPVVFRLIYRDQPIEVPPADIHPEEIEIPIPTGAKKLRLLFEDIS